MGVAVKVTEGKSLKTYWNSVESAIIEKGLEFFMTKTNWSSAAPSAAGSSYF